MKTGEMAFQLQYKEFIYNTQNNTDQVSIIGAGYEDCGSDRHANISKPVLMMTERKSGTLILFLVIDSVSGD